jgi:glycosyltransferase involved in cell wall biosynthesis
MPAVGDPVPPSACRYGPRMTTTESGITVGMPVWNAMPWLPEAIDSLFRQTTKAFAILVIADASTDGSTEYLRTLRDPRLRVVERPRAGLTAALNWLLDETRTPWLVRMDADDVSYPSRIAKLQAAIQAHPHAGLIYSLADYHPRERCAGQFRCSRGTSEELRSMVERGYLLSFCHSTVALRVDKVRAAGGYREGIRAEDADLWWRLARRFQICCIPEPLVGFRQHPASLSAEDTGKQELAGLYVQYLLLSELWGLAPRPMAEVSPLLLGFIEPSAVKAKEALRRLNMHLAQRQRLRALAVLARAIRASPRFVLRRLRDEFRHEAIANGVAPLLFWERKEVLWT